MNSWRDPAISEDRDLEAVRLASKSKDYVEMLMRAKSLVGRHPASGEAYFWLARAYSELKSTSDAITSYKEALKRKPDAAEFWHLLAACRTLVARVVCDDDGLHLQSERAQAYREHARTIRQR